MGTNRPPGLMESLDPSLWELVRVMGTKPQSRASRTLVCHSRMAFQSRSHLALHQRYLCNLFTFGLSGSQPRGFRALHRCSLAQSPLSQGLMSLGYSERLEIPAQLTGAFL